ncbi:aspirochlorine biosynthesis cytochrome P450 monooxygenase [Microdochium nivale]|nr:aspirochlorine biosynthesis cytochrome P450 monooxygenase [Microdochium nivale]
MASALHLTGLAALVAVAYLAGWAIYNVYLHPLAKVPGPKHLALSPFFREHHKIGGRWDHVLAALHEEYGPAVRFGPNQVSFITPDAWKTLYGHQSGAKQPPIKDPGFYFHDDGAASHIINANKEDHRRMRRVLAHAFSEKALRGQEDIIQHYTSLFINHMKAKAANAESFDIVLWYNFTTFDLIGDLAFGKPFGMLESGTYHPWVAMIFETLTMLPYLQIVSRFPALKYFLALVTPKHLIEGRKKTYATEPRDSPTTHPFG